MIIGPDGLFGPMGAGVSLAIGAKAAYPDREVVLYTGDGSFGFNAIELDTAVRFKLRSSLSCIMIDPGVL